MYFRILLSQLCWRKLYLKTIFKRRFVKIFIISIFAVYPSFCYIRSCLQVRKLSAIEQKFTGILMFFRPLLPLMVKKTIFKNSQSRIGNIFTISNFAVLSLLIFYWELFMVCKLSAIQHWFLSILMYCRPLLSKLRFRKPYLRTMMADLRTFSLSPTLLFIALSISLEAVYSL